MLFECLQRIPPGKRFSICPNGARRTCAIVQVSNSIFTKYIIEVARPDDWSISTIVLSLTNHFNLKTIEESIKQLLDGLVQKSGHWDQNVLSQCSGTHIEKLKHYQSDSPRDWAIKLTGKLLN
ncbi:Tn7-like element transposition protein TnsE [Paenibacillus apii]|uniref:Tn7-like element transposition protein TnsE n=1 Tax=Paenibacillus apii TaxID=1850370 RepID=UPI00143C343B|nr:hypothetical protein [Paenibacillus apii]